MLDESVCLEPYDPTWDRAFHLEQHRLATGLGLDARMIAHIGSTAVPGLLAKPIVDIMIGVAPFPPSAAFSDTMVALGYEALGEAGVPGRWYFRKRGDVPYNAHVVEPEGIHWVNNLALRDFLRTSPEAATQYASVKRAAVAAGATRLLSYSEAKGRMVEELVKRAREEQPKHSAG